MEAYRTEERGRVINKRKCRNLLSQFDVTGEIQTRQLIRILHSDTNRHTFALACSYCPREILFLTACEGAQITGNNEQAGI
jgi:hypothetical protein